MMGAETREMEMGGPMEEYAERLGLGEEKG